MYNCWFVDTPEIFNDSRYGGSDKIWIMWEQDAYRNCLLAHPRFETISMNAIWEVADGASLVYEGLQQDAAAAYCAGSFEGHYVAAAVDGAGCMTTCYASTWAAHHSSNY